MENLKILILKNDAVIASEVCEVIGADLGEPNCKLTNPCIMKQNHSGEQYFEPWPPFTDQKEIKISSDSIFKIVDPKPDIVELYLKAIK